MPMTRLILSTSQPSREKWVSDATALRYFALTNRVDLFVATASHGLVVPRQVLDPSEDPNRAEEFLSELGQSAQYWRKRPLRRDASAMRRYSLLATLRSRVDLEITDLTPKEQLLYSTLTSRRFARECGLRGNLARGEAAVIAISECRGFVPVIDERDGRRALARRVPGVTPITTLDVLKLAVKSALITEADARHIYASMRDEDYWGPDWE
jgi:predicted nucleic acid-binding protein